MDLLNQKAQKHYVLSSHCLFPSFGKRSSILYAIFFQITQFIIYDLFNDINHQLKLNCQQNRHMHFFLIQEKAHFDWPNTQANRLQEGVSKGGSPLP